MSNRGTEKHAKCTGRLTLKDQKYRQEPLKGHYHPQENLRGLASLLSRGPGYDGDGVTVGGEIS